MKSLFLTCALAVALGLGGVAAWAVVRVNPGIRCSVEICGSGLLGAPVALDEADVSLFAHSGELRGLHVGNPEGFVGPLAADLGTVRLDLAPESFSGPVVAVRSLEIDAPALTYERRASGASNLDVLLSNALESARTEQAARAVRALEGDEPGGGQFLRIDVLVVRGATLALGPGAAPLPLPDLRLEGIGHGRSEGGVVPAEAVATVLGALARAADQAVIALTFPSTPEAPSPAPGP